MKQKEDMIRSLWKHGEYLSMNIKIINIVIAHPCVPRFLFKEENVNCILLISVSNKQKDRFSVTQCP